MHSRENFLLSSYNSLIAEQINYYIRKNPNIQNPIGRGVFKLAREFRLFPLWAISFAQKDAQPENATISSMLIDDEDILIRLQVPRQYTSLTVEREIILDLHKNEALVERLYGVDKSSNDGKLLAVTALVERSWKQRIFNDQWLVVTQSPYGSELQGDIRTKSLKGLLQIENPIIYNTRFESVVSNPTANSLLQQGIT